MAGWIGLEFAGVIDAVAQRQVLLRQYAASQESYQRALVLFTNNETLDERTKALGTASVYHQLGYVAQEQRQWAQAEAHYRQALALYIEFNDRYRQGSTYINLGEIAMEHENWSQSREYFLNALTIAVEFKDEYRISTRLENLAHLHRAGGDGDLPAAVAGVLGVAVAEVVALFAQGVGEE